MIGISRLYCGELTSADGLRYGRRGDDSPNAPHAHAVARSAAERRPVTVWNSTRTCNLRCIHCYT
ncbi:MAG: 12,18-didecarboxysiroheme deacetylase, partial [Nitrospinota bacterium]